MTSKATLCHASFSSAQKHYIADMSPKLTTRPLFTEPSATDYMKASQNIARWIDSAAREEHGKVFWPSTPAEPEKASVLGEFSLYSGVLGPIMLFTQLYKTTTEQHYLHRAVSGAEYLIAHWNNGADVVLDMGVEGSEWGANLWTQRCGLGIQ